MHALRFAVILIAIISIAGYSISMLTGGFASSDLTGLALWLCIGLVAVYYELKSKPSKH